MLDGKCNIWYLHTVWKYAINKKICRMIDSGETGNFTSGAEGESKKSQAKGPGHDDAS